MIGRFLLDNGERTETTYGVKLTHPKIPFEYHVREMRIPSQNPYALENYKFFEWHGRDWLARRTFVSVAQRKLMGWPDPENGPQTTYELEGNEDHADEDIALALLSIN